jgi:hypothetical protein
MWVVDCNRLRRYFLLALSTLTSNSSLLSSLSYSTISSFSYSTISSSSTSTLSSFHQTFLLHLLSSSKCSAHPSASQFSTFWARFPSTTHFLVLGTHLKPSTTSARAETHQIILAHIMLLLRSSPSSSITPSAGASHLSRTSSSRL